MTWTLGLNGPPFGIHDPAACLVDANGGVLVLAEEERFVGKKHAVKLNPINAVEHCLASQGLNPSDITTVAFGWDPTRSTSGGPNWSSSDDRRLVFALTGWRKYGKGVEPEFVHVSHHLAHATVAFYSSGFREASVLIVDGQGEQESVSIYSAHLRHGLSLAASWPKSHSLGFMYDAATTWLGFRFLEAGRTMGLASYGRSSMGESNGACFRLGEDDFFPAILGKTQNADALLAQWRSYFSNLAGCLGPFQDHKNLHRDPKAVEVAWAAQRSIETAMQWLAGLARRTTNSIPLCIAGGVALNVAANAGIDGEVFVPPIPHDAGVALGAAWHVTPPAQPLVQLNPFLGLDIASEPHGLLIDRDRYTSEEADPGAVAERILRGEIGAIVEGRAEVGPRALGHRSIVALPAERAMRDQLNRLKRREPWRPFGATFLADDWPRLVEGNLELARYMIGAAILTEEGLATLPAATHADGTTRPQVVERTDGSFLTKLLTLLTSSGGTPAVVNTSFNELGKPIVNSTGDALQAMSKLHLDYCVIGDELVTERK